MTAAGVPTSPFLSRLTSLFNKNKTIPSSSQTIVPSNSTPSNFNTGTTNTITTSQPVSQQGLNPNTANTIIGSQSQGGGGIQNIVAGGQTRNFLPQDGIQATNQNLLRRAFAAGLEDILYQDVKQEQEKFASPMVRNFVTQNPDKFMQDLQASELARTRRAQTSDYLSNQLMSLAAGAQSDKRMRELNSENQQDILNQQNQRFKDVQNIRDFNVAVENIQADLRNKERAAEALRKKNRADKWASIATDAVFGDPKDQAQNQLSAYEYLDAETKIKTSQELKNKIKEMAQRQKEIDDEYSKILADLKVRYQNETDLEKRLKIQTEYETKRLEYENKRKALNEEFERYRDNELPLKQLEVSKQNQIRANRFINPTGIGLTMRKLAKGGQLSALDRIIIEREKSKLRRQERREEAENRRLNSLLLARLKKELEESLKDKERHEKLRFKLIESLIDSKR